MDPILRWALVLTFLGVLGWYYAGRPNLVQKLLAKIGTSDQATRGSSGGIEKNKASRRLKTKKSNGAESVDNIEVPSSDAKSKVHPEVLPVASGAVKKRKIETKIPFTTPSRDLVNKNPKALSTDARGVEAEADMANEEFAKQFAQVRAGTTLKPRDETGASKKERRARKRAAGVVDGSSDPSASPFTSTETSSMTGIDADDEVSPIATSTPLESITNVPIPRTGDVEDMLEGKGQGPTSLRLTLNASPVPRAQKKLMNEYQQVETKKQRQNRRKAEATKLLVQSSTQEHERKKEAQMRAARLAEGTSAQTRSSSFKAPTHNACYSKNNLPESPAVDKAAPIQTALLDTFDQSETGHPQESTKRGPSDKAGQSLASASSQASPPTTSQISAPQNQENTADMARSNPITEKEHEDLVPNFVIPATTETDQSKGGHKEPSSDDMDLTPKRSVKDSFYVTGTEVDPQVVPTGGGLSEGSSGQSSKGPRSATRGPNKKGAARKDDDAHSVFEKGEIARNAHNGKTPSLHIDWLSPEDQRAEFYTSLPTQPENEASWETVTRKGKRPAPQNNSKKDESGTNAVGITEPRRGHKKAKSEHFTQLLGEMEI